MLAQPAHAPLERLGDGWVFEPKLDGRRAQVNAVGVWSRPSAANPTPLNVAATYPEISVSEGWCLDGELVLLDAGRESLYSLARRTQGNQYRAGQVLFVAFDVLATPSDGDVSGEPLRVRRELLESLPPHPNMAVVRQSVDGLGLWADVLARGGEGVMAKQVNSAYLDGRHKSWVKFKRTARAAVIVVGATVGKQYRADTFGALHMVLMDGVRPVPVGKVGSGFSEFDLHRVKRLLQVGDPFVIDVQFARAIETDGVLALREPRFVCVRDDLSPADCRLAQLAEEMSGVMCSF